MLTLHATAISNNGKNQHFLTEHAAQKGTEENHAKSPSVLNVTPNKQRSPSSISFRRDKAFICKNRRFTPQIVTMFCLLSFLEGK